MEIQEFTKPSFSVIGKEGSTEDGCGFVQRLWADANNHFCEAAHLAARDEEGSFLGFWGIMTDFSRSFLPWEDNFSRGLYLAGVECADDAIPPAGWTKWRVPGFVYLQVPCDSADVFPAMIRYLEENNLPLAGAVQDFTCPRTGANYMCFPIKKL